jgi:type 1 fimbria pilin
MKKILLIVLAMVLLASPVFAAGWSVTVTWGRSIGPNLASEQVFYSGTSKCTVLPAAPTTCNFVIPTLTGEVWIRSYNTQGAFADTSHVAISPEPAAATGVIVTITSVP